jgi:hypothetical protein
MNRPRALVLAALALLLPCGAALAQPGAPYGSRAVSSVSWVEEWDPASQQWLRIEEGPAAITPASRAGSVTITDDLIAPPPVPVRFIGGTPRLPAAATAIAAFGPFRVLDSKHAALVGATDAASPHAFAAMLAQFPGLEVIEFVDAPGTTHDLANLRLGRAIRAAGLATHVPAGGSARSGAVELFLAGTRRSADPGALFAVHSWRDEAGREPADFAPDAPENRLYLDYYTEMGMTANQARAFYALTNSVPHAGALWIEGREMARWIAPTGRSIDADSDAAGAVRVALARSAGLLADALRAPLVAAKPRPAFAPRIAYAFTGAGPLDSGAAFP